MRACVRACVRDAPPGGLLGCISKGPSKTKDQATSRTIHQPCQCSTARSMLCSKLCQTQSPKPNARNATGLVLMRRAFIHEGSCIGLRPKTSRTIHQPRQCSTARSMLCSKLRQHQSPGQNARSHLNQGPSGIADNSSAMAMLDRAFDAMLGAVSDPEPEAERPKLPEPGNDLH